MFIAHHLSLCDVRLAFEMATARSSVFTLQGWIGDRELHQSPMRVKDPKTSNDLPIIPDAAFSLTLPDGSEQSFFVEMDMSTVAPKRMRAKLRAYLIRKGDPTPVLFVVPNESRRSAIVQWALEEAQDLGADPTIFWITTKNAVTETTALSSPIWQVVGVQTPISLESLALDHKEPSLNGESTFLPMQAVHLANGGPS